MNLINKFKGIHHCKIVNHKKGKEVLDKDKIWQGLRFLEKLDHPDKIVAETQWPRQCQINKAIGKGADDDFWGEREFISKRTYEWNVWFISNTDSNSIKIY